MGVVSSILLGSCLAGLAVAFYMKLVGYDPVSQPRALRVAIVLGGEFLGALCLVAGMLIGEHLHWTRHRLEAPWEVWIAIASALLGAGIVTAWLEYHRKVDAGNPGRDPLV